MPLVLRYKGQTSLPVELEGLTPEAAATSTIAELARRPLYHGNAAAPLAEFFDLAGSAADDETLVFEGDLSGVHWIGQDMHRGVIRIEGNAGRHLGADMRGGAIYVSGSAGDWLGAEMRGGRIEVRGNCGDLAGSAYRGARRGMAGGCILIHGNAGHELGHKLRRGLIAVGGDLGDSPGFKMIAGSIFAFGRCGLRPGAGMRRGTIALFGSWPPLLPTFRPASSGRPTFLRLMLRELAAGGFPVPPHLAESEYRRYSGDFLELGKGEILVRAA